MFGRLKRDGVGRGRKFAYLIVAVVAVIATLAVGPMTELLSAAAEYCTVSVQNMVADFQGEIEGAAASLKAKIPERHLQVVKSKAKHRSALTQPLPASPAVQPKAQGQSTATPHPETVPPRKEQENLDQFKPLIKEETPQKAGQNETPPPKIVTADQIEYWWERGWKFVEDGTEERGGQKYIKGEFKKR